MASLMDVASAAAVSKSLASRVLSGAPEARVSAQTRQRVLDAAKELKYVPSHRARALRSSRSGALGLIVPDVNNAVFADLLAGVQARAQQAGMTVLLGQVERSDSGHDELEALVKQGRVDGLVLQRREDFDDEQLCTMMEGLPSVLVNSCSVGRVGSVVLDDHAGLSVAVKHLVGLGHRDIGHLAGVPQHDAARRRLDGFHRSMSDAGLPVNPDWIFSSGWEARGGRAAMTELLAAQHRPTAVIVGSVNAAIGAVSTALSAGLRVPAQLSVIGINDTWMAEFMVPSVTTVRMPLRELGARAADMLVGSLDGNPLSDLVLTDPAPELIIRGSTAPFVA